MGKTILLLVTIILANISLVSGQSIPLIIFDTDMGPDYDDVGALATLHALAAKGECKILATVSSDSHPSISPTIEVINRYFHRSDIPIGSPSDKAPSFTAKNGWNDSLIHMFLPEIKTNDDYPNAVEVYRKILSNSSDTSITIVTVGFTTNLADLLRSTPDKYSPLNGMELVRKKVKKYVAMAAGFPTGREFNVYRDSTSSYEVFNNWPTPILFSGFEIGVKIKTGQKTAESQVKRSPIQWAYEYNLQTYLSKPEPNRSSWDQTAVLVAVRPVEDYFYVNGPGKLIINSNGTNSWDPDTNASHYFLVHKYPYNHIAEILEDLMMQTP